MAVVRQHITQKYAVLRNFICYRTIMTSTSTRTEKVVEELIDNPYYKKYADKISTIQQTIPNEFLSRIEAHKSKTKPKLEGIKERQYSPLLKPKDNISPTSSKDKSLNDIMKVDLIKDKNASEIESIWREYHLHKDVIAATISATVYETITSRSEKYPTFILPLPRSEGYEFFMCQFFKNTVHFTPLICFQVHKENAPECLTIFHYTEFKISKELVLMRGEFDKDVLDAKEALCLTNQFKMYYGQEDVNKLKLLETFTNNPDQFKHMVLISEIENLSL